jgi:L-cysteine desulfidase
LANLDSVDDNALRQAEALLTLVTVRTRRFPDPLTIQAEVSADGDELSVTIANDYSHIAQVTGNGSVLFAASAIKSQVIAKYLSRCHFSDLFAIPQTLPVKDLDFLIEAAELTHTAAHISLASPPKLAAALAGYSHPLPAPFGAMHRAKLMTAAASGARMLGLQAPVMAISGSGNHGVLCLIRVDAVAEELKSSRDQLARPWVISAFTTVPSKVHIQRMTAVCGCTVAAAPGLAAATAYLLGGSYGAASHAIQTVIATLAGLVCDGGKESCAYKIGAAAAFAVQAGYLAVRSVHVPDNLAIVGRSVEETFKNLGRLNNPGMVETDRLIITLLEESLAQNDLDRNPD